MSLLQALGDAFISVHYGRRQFAVSFPLMRCAASLGSSEASAEEEDVWGTELLGDKTIGAYSSFINCLGLVMVRRR